jgi:hypothetical protein
VATLTVRAEATKAFLNRFVCALRHRTNFVQKNLAVFGFAALAPCEVLRKILQNVSPAGVTSPFVVRRCQPTALPLYR